LAEQYECLQNKLNALPGYAGTREGNQTKQRDFQELASLEPIVKLSEKLKNKEQVRVRGNSINLLLGCLFEHSYSGLA